MFPIRDHNPSGRTPFVVYTLIMANLLGFAMSGAMTVDDGAMMVVFADWALIPARVSEGRDWSTFFSSMFLHGGWMHLLGNMLFLWIFGDNLEDAMGHLGFALFYVAAGIGAGIIHVISAPGSPVPTVGASGAIAGVMGGYLLLFPRARIDVLLIIVVFFRVFAVPAWVMLGVWAGFQLLGSMVSDPNVGGVAYWAHTGGFTTGLVLTVPVWLRRGGIAWWRRNHGKPPHPQGEYKLVRSRIPRVPRR
jgi:membrane associated rhomboid family serine protease